MSSTSNSFYIWTLYVSEDEAANWDKNNIIPLSIDGFSCYGYRFDYPMRYDREYAGSNAYCLRLTFNSIVDACKHYGFSVKKLEEPNTKDHGQARVNLLFTRNL